ncbi:hypothetical protein ACN27F_28805 [Solwaraspora sp. WMMB335]|uniref:hypothetical protein n=1 Tax=Solwaraspora sp. WMMB335 TaxID=3404118 RepID=UPI003B954C69
MAALAGSWIALVAGFGGLRDDRGALDFDPQLPDADPFGRSHQHRPWLTGSWSTVSDKLITAGKVSLAEPRL